MSEVTEEIDDPCILALHSRMADYSLGEHWQARQKKGDSSFNILSSRRPMRGRRILSSGWPVMAFAAPSPSFRWS